MRVGSEQLAKLSDRYPLLVKLVDLRGNPGRPHFEVLGSISLKPIWLGKLESNERAATVLLAHLSLPSGCVGIFGRRLTFWNLRAVLREISASLQTSVNEILWSFAY